MNEPLIPLQHRRIPTLPTRPRVHPTAHKIFRSYPVGRVNFSRTCQGRPLPLIISIVGPIPSRIKVNLVTTLNSNGTTIWTTFPFAHKDERTLVCTVTPKSPGFHTFRAEFSLDGGETWSRDNVPDAWVLVDPPQVDGLRIYSMIPTVSGTITDWKANLKHIADMGFNAIHLLPVTSLDTSESPYAAKDLFDLDQSYLDPTDTRSGLSQLEDFIEEARTFGLRLCFDLVLNHIGIHSTMVNRAPDWIVPDQSQPDGLQRAGYWNEKGWMAWEDLALINYEHPSEMIRTELWSYMMDYALFWAKYANDTGGFVRFDNLHSSNSDFIQAIATALHEEFPNVAILAEYFTDERQLLRTTPRWGLNLILATPWNYRFVPQLRDYLKYIHRLAEQVRYFMPITSHDSGSPAEEFGTPDSTVPRYVAAALLGTGATGITEGVEYGESKRIDFIGRHPKTQYPADARYGLFIGVVNAILVDHPAFQSGGNCEFVDNGHDAVIAAFRKSVTPGETGFLVVCNFDIYHTQQISIDMTSFLGSIGPFTAVDLISLEASTFDSSHLSLQVNASSAQVLRFHTATIEQNNEQSVTNTQTSILTPTL